jgi:hypothetical protein
MNAALTGVAATLAIAITDAARGTPVTASGAASILESSAAGAEASTQERMAAGGQARMRAVAWESGNLPGTAAANVHA